MTPEVPCGGCLEPHHTGKELDQRPDGMRSTNWGKAVRSYRCVEKETKMSISPIGFHRLSLQCAMNILQTDTPSDYLADIEHKSMRINRKSWERNSAGTHFQSAGWRSADT
jgi:hypothetical protein